MKSKDIKDNDFVDKICNLLIYNWDIWFTDLTCMYFLNCQKTKNIFLFKSLQYGVRLTMSCNCVGAWWNVEIKHKFVTYRCPNWSLALWGWGSPLDLWWCADVKILCVGMREQFLLLHSKEATVVQTHGFLSLLCFLEDVGQLSQHPLVYNRSILAAVIDEFQDPIYLLSGFTSVTPCSPHEAITVLQFLPQATHHPHSAWRTHVSC